ncbi:hypothetical protein HNQ51_002079 [Inhella inkyongensis]|uniref:DUF4390 domain-containing protein n=1 Tax=Inhella inkyongensis TaxID=392593 RepID=A0A840S363_9BURK|nr:hypothetical protein [Inhella inkyongensis]MBB5204765.1 hypothetical protein [Inhella inkyongensis]
MQTRRLLAALMLTLLPPLAGAHELQDDRLTLVLRESRHLSLSLRLDYPALLQRALAPQRPEAETVLALSTLDAAQLQAALRPVQQRIEQGLRLQLGPTALALQQWQWPRVEQVQALLRRAAMQQVLGEHAHEDESLEVRAQALAPRPVAGLQLQLPPLLPQLVVVSYQPQQQTLKHPAAPQSIAFAPPPAVTLAPPNPSTQATP